jgi:hypothetical protein
MYSGKETCGLDAMSLKVPPGKEFTMNDMPKPEAEFVIKKKGEKGGGEKFES